MRNILLKIILVFIFMNNGYNQAKSQYIDPSLFEESIRLVSDRTLYISGEKVQFAAYLFLTDNSNSDNLSDKTNGDELVEVQVKKSKKIRYSLSNIIYVELITPTGVKVVGGKFLIENAYSEGCISIPNELMSGTYYLRAYTKFMRNNGNDLYSYISLKIVNPLKSDVAPDSKINSIVVDSSKSDNILLNRDIAALSIDKTEYLTREQVIVHIDEGVLKKNSIKNLSISVIPDFSINENETVRPLLNKPSSQFYYPETNGISLTGRIKDSNSDNTLPNITVNLSILGNYKEVTSVKTDSIGRFFFKLPYIKGVKNIFLSTEKLADLKSIIQIDNDFCQSNINLPTLGFRLSEDEKQVAYNLALNAQVESHFCNTLLKDSIKNIDISFYGEPNSKLILDNYIQLPTLEDYINELIPVLSIRKQDGRKTFKLFSYQSETSIYDPLVLLDMAAIDDPDKILSIAPQKISHIEIINSSYVKGDFIYGGIISFFSKKGNYAGIDLPTSGVFLDYKFYTDITNCLCDNKIADNKPDARNTLLWEPNLKLKTGKSNEISFNTSDTPGKYIILLRGNNNNGQLFSNKLYLNIVPKK